MNANVEKCLGENTYKRRYNGERKRRIVVNEGGSAAAVAPIPKTIDFNNGSYALELDKDDIIIPYLPIAPGLPDNILHQNEILQDKEEEEHHFEVEVGGIPRQYCDDDNDYSSIIGYHLDDFKSVLTPIQKFKYSPEYYKYVEKLHKNGEKRKRNPPLISTVISALNEILFGKLYDTEEHHMRSVIEFLDNSYGYELYYENRLNQSEQFTKFAYHSQEHHKYMTAIFGENNLPDDAYLIDQLGSMIDQDHLEAMIRKVNK